MVVQKCHPTPGILDIGRFPSGVDDTAESIAADLRRAGFASEARGPTSWRWKHRKLLMNLGNGVQACCRPGDDADALVDLVTAEGEQVARGRRHPARLGGARTASAAATSCGRATAATARSPVARPGRASPAAPGTSRPTTSRGEIVLLGRLHGVPTPANELLQRTAHELARSRGPVASLDAADLLAQLPLK